VRADLQVELGNQKVARREQTYRQQLPPVALEHRHVIIVDDGLASGFTMRVAIASARKQHAAEIMVAIPTAHAESVVDVAQRCDHVYCANVREGLRYAVADAYGVWKEKSMYGRTYMGIERSTFLIDEEGVVTEAWRKVKAKGHAELVADALSL